MRNNIVEKLRNDSKEVLAKTNREAEKNRKRERKNKNSGKLEDKRYSKNKQQKDKKETAYESLKHLLRVSRIWSS